MKRSLLLLTVAIATCFFLAIGPYQVTHKIVTSNFHEVNPEEKPGAPAGRGPNELVIYLPDYGNRTGTNIWGVEAIVQDGIIQHIGGNDSPIPDDGLVLSGHGQARLWILENLTTGMEVEVDFDDRVIEASYSDKSRLFLLEDEFNLYNERSYDAFFHHSDDLEQRFERTENRLQTLQEGLEEEGKLNERLVRQTRDDLEWIYWEQFPYLSENRGMKISPFLVAEYKEDILEFADKFSINALYLPLIDRKGSVIEDVPLYPENQQALSLEKWNEVFSTVQDNEISVHLIYSPLKINPAWQLFINENREALVASQMGRTYFEVEGAYYLCPLNPDNQDKIIEYNEFLKDSIRFDGIVLEDYYLPVEGEYDSCYCESCSGQFFSLTGIDPNYFDFVDSEDHEEKWKQWRHESLNEFLEKLQKTYPDEVKRGLHLTFSETSTPFYDPHTWLNKKLFGYSVFDETFISMEQYRNYRRYLREFPMEIKYQLQLNYRDPRQTADEITGYYTACHQPPDRYIFTDLEEAIVFEDDSRSTAREKRRLQREKLQKIFREVEIRRFWEFWKLW